MADEEVTPEVISETPTPTETQAELPLADTPETPPETEKIEAAPPETPPETPPEEPKADWRDKELKAKHRRQKELERALADKEAELETQRALLAKFNQGKTETPAVVPIDEVERKAQEIVSQREYVQKSNAVNADGEKEYKDAWKDAVANLELLGGFDMATMNGILATDAPAKVLFEMGKNPENYHRLMQLPLERRIIEMGKMAMQPVTKQVSNAPAPVSPVGGRAAPAKETLSDNMDDDKWFSIRRQQKLAKFQASHLPRR